MAMTSLPPGFRFHPTDVELVLYHLKRKVLGKKFPLETIAEVNIYKFSPWDLPDKSCLKSKDLEWFFFCPREKKYASGSRVKRATENGYWKVTGKDRSIIHNDKTVGMVKTLIFHLGHAPRGERTDWVLHEYRILDDQLAAAGVQDIYVLCKVFKKNGLGPKNGAQYGAPFNEADWLDDVDDTQNNSVSLASDDPSPTTLLQTEEQSFLPGGLFDHGNKSGLSLIEGPSTSCGHPTSELFVDETDDDIIRLLASFTDDDMLLFHENEVNQDDLGGKGKNVLPCSDGHDIYNGLGNLNSWSEMNDERLDFLGMKDDTNSLKNQPYPDNSTYIELDDFLPPLDCSAGVMGPVQTSDGEIFGSYRHDNIPQFDFGASSAGMDKYGTCVNQLPVLPEGSHDRVNCLDVLQTVHNPFNQGCNAAYDLDFALTQLDNGVNFAQDMERGTHRKLFFSRLMGSIPARSPSAALHIALSFSPFGGSSIHIKAEVTHGAGECTNEALSFMMEGSSSCWCTLPCAVFQEMRPFVENNLVSLPALNFDVALVYCYLNMALCFCGVFTVIILMKILFIFFPT